MRKYLLLFLLSITLLFASNHEENLEKVSLQLHWKYQFEFAGFIAAKEKGFYKDAGLDVDLKEYKNGIDIEQDVLDGKSTYGIYNSYILLEYLRGKPLVLLSSYFKRAALVLLTTPDIKSPKDLIGKKIMTTSKEDFTLNFGPYFKAYGVTPDELTFVPMSYNVKDLADGKVSAFSAFISSEPYNLDKMGAKYNILNPSNDNFYILQLELFTSQKEAKKHPLRTQAFIDASIKGWQYALTHKQELVDIIHNKYNPNISKAALKAEALSIEKLILPYTYKIGSIDKNFLFKQQQLFEKNYHLKKKHSLHAFIFNDKEINYALIWESSCGMGIVLLLMFLYQRKLKSFNTELAKQVELKTKELREMNESLEESVHEKVEELIQKDELLTRQSKQAVMGEMISMIAHQWRQPLNTITLQISNLQLKEMIGKELSKEELDKTLSEISETILYLSNTIDDFKSYFQPDKKRTDILLHDLLEKVEGFIEPRLKKHNISIEIKGDVEQNVALYVNEMVQVLLNILNNAVDAYNNCDVKDKKIIIATKIEDKISISIKDSAGGISKEHLKDIFEPYFSTKGKNGTGLGLYMSKMIIEKQFNGTLEVESQNKETTFYITIPKHAHS